MVRDIRFAGLNERLHRQLNQTTRFISNSYNKAQAVEWDGSRCDALVADIRSPVGRNAIDVAENAGVPVVVVTEDANATPHPCIGPNATAARLTRAIDSILPRSSVHESRTPPALLRLATEEALRGRDIDATLQNRTIRLRPTTGQVFAYSHSDLRELTAHLTDRDWAFKPAARRELAQVSGLASMSLEAFYLLGAHANSDKLPAVSDGDLQLVGRPELGDAAQLDYPRRVVDALNHGARNAGEICLQKGLTPPQVRVCVWSLRAAGRLRFDSEALAASEHRGRFAQFLSRLRTPGGDYPAAS